MLLINSLAIAFDSLGFRVVGAVFTVAVVLLWAAVAVPTAVGFWCVRVRNRRR